MNNLDAFERHELVSYFLSPKKRSKISKLRKWQASTLDSDMQCYNATRQIVIVHMPKAPFVHHGL